MHTDRNKPRLGSSAHGDENLFSLAGLHEKLAQSDSSICASFNGDRVGIFGTGAIDRWRIGFPTRSPEHHALRELAIVRSVKLLVRKPRLDQRIPKLRRAPFRWPPIDPQSTMQAPWRL